MKVVVSTDDELAPDMEFELTPVLLMTRGDQFIGTFTDKEAVIATWPDREVTITED